ncbi:MAG: SDR family oxidoreductase [Parasphingorhabdus sp.]|uniref:SDR family oxidoreductase n=1 Tax=Parasphingorhabdus sp. TaxID=2709688 RepID=UPI003002994D
MNLGIEGRRAIVCGASRGLGRAVAESLAEAGVNLVLNARGLEGIEQAADEIRKKHGVKVDTLAGDLTTEEGCNRMADAFPSIDILINNAGGPPAGDWRSFEREDWRTAADRNMIGPIFLIRNYLDGMVDQGFGRIVNITSIVVKQPKAVLSLSVAARLGLTGAVKAIAPSVACNNVTINNLLPELFDTDRLRQNLTTIGKKNGRTLEEEMAEHLKNSPAKRLGRPEELGATCAFLCSEHAGFITGQSILLDGGFYPGLF